MRTTTQATMDHMDEGDKADRRLDTGFDLSTMQGVFDHVVTALLNQDGKSFLSHAGRQGDDDRGRSVVGLQIT